MLSTSRDQAPSNNRVMVTVRKSTMSPEMEQQVIRVAVNALNHTNQEKDAAHEIKAYFDSHYECRWHCIVGKKFGCYVSHFDTDFIYFYANTVAVLLFRTAEHPDVVLRGSRA
uniref:Dynein light chain n=1 Tax=Panagrellus redivivus TaxID=6233 RepID=A0A7E4ZZ98_PANRE